MNKKKAFVCLTICIVFNFCFYGLVLSEENPKILKIASKEKIILVEIDKKVKTICIGDVLSNYGVLSEVFDNKLVFKIINSKQVETVIITIAGGTQTTTRISKQNKAKPIQVPLQSDNQ